MEVWDYLYFLYFWMDIKSGIEQVFPFTAMQNWRLIIISKTSMIWRKDFTRGCFLKVIFRNCVKRVWGMNGNGKIQQNNVKMQKRKKIDHLEKIVLFYKTWEILSSKELEYLH